MRQKNSVLTASEISKSFQGQTGVISVLDRISLAVSSCEILAIVGPSGCGKTTLLRILADLIAPDSGNADYLHGIDGVSPMLIFQNYESGLMPHLTVKANVELALLRTCQSDQIRVERIQAALSSVGLEKFSNAFPWELSGGMKQRILFARALAMRPPCLLLDEPFASVDAQTRYGLEDMLRTLVADHQSCAIYVTHDVDSAIYVADRVAVLTSRPSKLVAEHAVHLGKKRSQAVTKGSPEFYEIRKKVYESLIEGR